MAPTAVLERPPAAPPAGRDLTVDLLRAVAMVLVAAGHWLVVVPSYRDGRFGGVNALGTVPLMRGLTWAFQVMPLFFAIGGYAGAASWASHTGRGGAYADWLRARLPPCWPAPRWSTPCASAAGPAPWPT
jgi:peptidoglycan/LPS O-acetylase OafA/YrhL